MIQKIIHTRGNLGAEDIITKLSGGPLDFQPESIVNTQKYYIENYDDKT